ncbi:MAG: hypothetical protein RI973_2034 [Bacteroidota bacterium]|jgi:uncharacterized protein (TIGR02145 family)
MKTQSASKSNRPSAAKQKARGRSLAVSGLLAILLLPYQLLSQTEPSALVDFQSTDKGFLLPRMTQTERDAIASPATGLIIYNTTANCLQINGGSPSAPLWISLGFTGTVSALNCGAVAVAGTAFSGKAAAGVSVSVPYTGGNGGSHPGQTVASTGVTGLMATLAAGSFASGTGNLVFTISGTPDTHGTASFALAIGGQGCVYNLAVAACGAYVAPNVWKNFMCHNLGAENTAADPFTPGWEIIGGYWQWGRPAMAAPGPWGPDNFRTNEGPVSGWNLTSASNGSWSDVTKTANDPCPAGFRLPTKAQWDGVLANNTQSIAGGGWYSPSSSQYGSGRLFGPYLMLPATGYRTSNDGELFNRGAIGNYWVTTVNGSFDAWNLEFDLFGATMKLNNRRNGFSLRCIAE